MYLTLSHPNARVYTFSGITSIEINKDYVSIMLPNGLKFSILQRRIERVTTDNAISLYFYDWDYANYIGNSIKKAAKL